MNNLIKYSIAASAVMALAARVNAGPTLVVEDGGLTIASIATDPSGVEIINAHDANWSVVIASGISEPPVLGAPASAPVMDLGIQATYIGSGAGNPLTISFANDQFGPTKGNFIANISGLSYSGTPNPVNWTLYWAAGAGHLPTVGTPLPGGVSSTSASFSLTGPIPTLNSGAVNLGNPYSLGEEIVLTGSTGSGYSFDADIKTVPDGGMTLMFLGSALSGLALLKRKLS